MRKTILSLAVSAAAIASLTLTPGVASAQELAPSSCNSGIGYSEYAWAKCTSGTGYVRAVAKCSDSVTTVRADGAWAKVGTQSSAYCPHSYYVVGHSFITKS